MALGNPAPLGLLCFGMTTLTLMYVEMGWAEVESELTVAALALALGGFGQVLAGIFEILKGSSFSFAVFVCYGAFWWTWAIVFVLRNDLTSLLSDQDSFKKGQALYLAQWGILSSCFWVVTWRKNVCLIAIFFLLSSTFFLLSIATGTGSEPVKKAGGYFGFLTAVGAFYTGVAELINEEYGRMVLPGLAPVYSPQRVLLTKDTVLKLINYQERTNTLWLQFRGLQIRSKDDVDAIREGVTEAIQNALQAERSRRLSKVHVVADYDQTFISDDIAAEYWKMASALEQEYYLSATRFHISSFGTSRDSLGGTGMFRVTSSPNVYVARETRSDHKDEDRTAPMTHNE